MNGDPTKELPGASPFEKRVLAELGALRNEVAEIRAQQVAMAKNVAALDQRLTSREETVDSRLKETRPIWEAVRAQIEKLDEKFSIFIRDLYDIRGDISLNEKRLVLLERHVLT